MARQIYQYVPCAEMDWVLLQWLDRMRNDRELNKVFSQGAHAPSSFLAMMQAPRQLFFQLDGLGNLKYACWLEPCMGNVFLGYYAQPAYRKNREGVHFLFDVFEYVFNAGVGTIAGFIQERKTPEETQAFIKLHEKMGYTYRGFIPLMFDGKDCHVVALTAEDWAKPNKMKERWKRERSKEEGN